MQRCIDIARSGLSVAMPNPSVGAVIVLNDCIIAQGFTSAFGGAHAEVNAINAVKDKSILSCATLYVSLEPCSHFGKTPPCCDLIIKYHIKNVVVGCLDSDPKVAGRGIEKIRNAGANVIVGVLEAECRESNKRFFKFHEQKRPYIILKWAQSTDGFLSPAIRNTTKPVWLTNVYSQQLVHKWRTEEQAILIGTQTAIDDNPSLTARSWFGKNPVRIVLDQHSRIPKSSTVFDTQAETFVLNQENIDFSGNVAAEITTFLYQKNIQSVIIEGGARTLQTFIDANLWDEARVFTTKKYFLKGTKSPILKTKTYSTKNILNDKLSIYINQ